MCGRWEIIYALLSGHLPFNNKSLTDAEVRGKIKCGAYAEIEKISGLASLLLRSMLTVDPEQRITVSQIKNHPWLTPSISSFRKLWQILPTITLMNSISPSA